MPGPQEEAVLQEEPPEQHPPPLGEGFERQAWWLVPGSTPGVVRPFTQHLLGARGALVDLAMGPRLSVPQFPSWSHGLSMVPASRDG